MFYSNFIMWWSLANLTPGRSSLVPTREGSRRRIQEGQIGSCGFFCTPWKWGKVLGARYFELMQFTRLLPMLPRMGSLPDDDNVISKGLCAECGLIIPRYPFYITWSYPNFSDIKYYTIREESFLVLALTSMLASGPGCNSSIDPSMRLLLWVEAYLLKEDGRMHRSDLESLGFAGILFLTAPVR